MFMSKIREVSLVSGGGALGGILSVISVFGESVFGTQIISSPFSTFLNAILIPTLKGGVAAGLGVYLLANSDMTNLVRVFFFSIACGLVFPSILDQAATVASKTTTQLANQQVSVATETIKQSVESGVANTADIDKAIQEIRAAQSTASPIILEDASQTLEVIILEGNDAINSTLQNLSIDLSSEILR
jgi:hypothetical protein